MSSFFEEKTKQLNILLRLTSLLMQNINCYLKKFSFSLGSVSLHKCELVVTDYTSREKMRPSKRIEKNCLVFFPLSHSLLITCSEIILRQW